MSLCAGVQERLLGIVTLKHGRLAALKTESIGWNSNIRKVLALCNDLVPLQRSMLAGPLDQKKDFKSVEAAFLVTATG